MVEIKELQITKIEDLTFSIVDTETTGMHSEFNRIMDIGIVTMKNGKILDKWESLIDPQQSVPYWITEYTKLSYKDVKGQPKFNQVATKIIDKIQNTVFVAHNVGFDYWFLHHELRRINYFWNSPKLCTVMLGRKLIPELKYVNLDILSDYYNIEISARHRALPDAEATAYILKELIGIAKERYNAKTFFDLEKLQKIKIDKNTVGEPLALF